MVRGLRSAEHGQLVHELGQWLDALAWALVASRSSVLCGWHVDGGGHDAAGRAAIFVERSRVFCRVRCGLGLASPAPRLAWPRMDWGLLVGLLLLACLMTLLATRGMPTDAALQALAKTAPAGLALLAGALQWAQAFSGNPQRLRAHATPRAGVQPPWRAGVAAGMQCVARCALPMLALHAIYGMSLVMMACYTGWLWWRAGTDSPWPGVVGGLALMGSAASTLPFSFT
jgi:hypothetical protein